MTTLNVRCGQLIDGLGQTVPDALVEIEDDRFAAVGSWKAGSASTPDQAWDFSDYTVLPGLIEAHAHLGLIGAGLTLSPAEIAAHVFTNARLALEEGFTTVRDAGGIDGGVAACVDTGLVPGPKIMPSGPFISQTAGHQDGRGRWYGEEPREIPGLVRMAIVCDGPDAVRRAVRDAFRRGATQIKVTVSGGVASGTNLDQCQFSIEELEVAVAEAKARDTYVHAHAHTSASIKHGIAAGIRHFEHGSILDKETADLMRETGTALVPTLLILNRLIDAAAPEQAAKLAGLRESMHDSVRIAYDAGVTVGSGSDLLGTSQQGRGEEIVLKSGLLGPMAAIMSATSVNAALMGIGDRVGSVAPGRQADLVVVDGDPLADPSVLVQRDRIVCVIRNGQIVHDNRQS